MPRSRTTRSIGRAFEGRMGWRIIP
jgi:hypothetical protein